MINKILAVANLEVQYPTLPNIAGQNAATVTDLPSYIKYMFSAGMTIGFIAVLFGLVIAGIMYFLSAAKPELQREAKDRIFSAISGLLILVLTYLIITTINPQLNIFNIDKLQDVSLQPVAAQKLPGVYFYNADNCDDNSATPFVSNIEDLGTKLKKNNLKKVDVVADTANGHSFFTITYENPNFWGKCQYFNGKKKCAETGNFVSSASIYEYDPNPNGEGVYFFRKPCLNDKPYYNKVKDLIEHCSNKSGDVKNPTGPPDANGNVPQPTSKSMGGYYEVKNDAINGIYVANLDDLTFEGVDETEQECTKYDKEGRCEPGARTPPTLAGENISSIIIDGNYLVLLVYVSPEETAQSDDGGPWSFCQEFPTTNDVNRIGPRQIKWELIRNSSSRVPNAVAIIPIKPPLAAPQSLAPVITPIK